MTTRLAAAQFEEDFQSIGHLARQVGDRDGTHGESRVNLSPRKSERMAARLESRTPPEAKLCRDKLKHLGLLSHEAAR
jgi:hypothetical protein